MSAVAPAPELRVPITELGDAVVAGLLVRRAGLDAGLDPKLAAELALAASELATNMVKYARGGELHFEIDREADEARVTALDRGPGPPSPDELFVDGISRGAAVGPDHDHRRGRGTGGGALRRLCDDVEIEAREGGGAIIRCRKRISPRKR